MMKKILLILSVLFSFVIVQPLMAARIIKLGVVTKPGSAQNIVAEKFRELLEHWSSAQTGPGR